MFDLHHVPNAEDATRLIKDFDVSSSVAIALPRIVHWHLKSMNFQHVNNGRDLLAVEILRLKKYTNIPNEVLKEIIAANIHRYPELKK